MGVTAFGPLAEFARDVHSQFGEDGILGEILSRLGIAGEEREKWCVEFGAWDGMYLSNTYRLIDEDGWRAVLIEGDPARHADLCRNIPSDRIAKLCRFVGFGETDSLDAILSETDIPAEFDLLSIDIDGCDYHVWESLSRYRPKVVVIEYNPTIPVEVPYIQPRDFSIKHGNGVKALDDLARAKGYRTVALTVTNVIAVREELVEQVLGSDAPAIETLAPAEARQFLFRGYDGTLLSNRDRLPGTWHALPSTMADIQVLPRWLRRYPHDYTALQRAGFRLLRSWHKLRRAIRGM
jgi:predicted O-methyltransferase YrrM